MVKATKWLIMLGIKIIDRILGVIDSKLVSAIPLVPFKGGIKKVLELLILGSKTWKRNWNTSKKLKMINILQVLKRI